MKKSRRGTVPHGDVVMRARLVSCNTTTPMKDQYCERLHEHRPHERGGAGPATRRLAARALSCLAAAVLAGCSASPSISVLGAFFPDWMFCVLGGLAITLVVRGVLAHLQRERALGAPVIAYPALLLLFSLLIWLLIFNS
jgi:hypothetical protein